MVILEIRGGNQLTENSRRLKNLIGGNWLDSSSETYENVYNPATKEIIAQVPLSTTEELDFAVEEAAKAFKNWKRVAVQKRAKILFKYQHLLEKNRQQLAGIITTENGKNLKEALAEVSRGIENVEFATGVPTLMMGDTLSTIATDVEIMNYRYPIGVVGGITPFNFPMMVPCWMFPMAIATGNTFILKPSERTPLLAERLGELLIEAGLPAGVFSLVHGAHDVVNGLLDHAKVKAISFVGSQPVGEYVYKRGSENLKRVQALTGAKNHSIVLNDADVELAIPNIISSAFGSAGERCMACAVVTVEEGIADEFVAGIVAQANALIVGNGLNEDVFLGPVIREGNLNRTIDYIEKGIEEGATLVADGRTIENTEGYFIGPTIFDNVTVDMDIWKDEIFAPLLSIVRVKNLKEAVNVANASKFANGACIYTSNASAIRYFREEIEAGMLGVNLGVPAPISYFPFSGWKDSFYGTLPANGKDGVEFYTRKKVVTANYKAPEFD